MIYKFSLRKVQILTSSRSLTNFGNENYSFVGRKDDAENGQWFSRSMGGNYNIKCILKSNCI